VGTLGGVEELKAKFIEETRVANAISDATKIRRGRRIFEKTATHEQEAKQKLKREEFALELGSMLRRYAKEYTVVVEDGPHIANIRDLRKYLSDNYQDILNDHELVFGVAQKALNVYLKYLWCADGTTIPPHCPFDNIVLKEISPRKIRKQPYTFEERWTYANENQYREWVALARDKAGQKSLSAWELEVWQAAQERAREEIAQRIAARIQNPSPQ
jgi:hypothetical protein